MFPTVNQVGRQLGLGWLKTCMRLRVARLTATPLDGFVEVLNLIQYYGEGICFSLFFITYFITLRFS